MPEIAHPSTYQQRIDRTATGSKRLLKETDTLLPRRYQVPLCFLVGTNGHQLSDGQGDHSKDWSPKVDPGTTRRQGPRTVDKDREGQNGTGRLGYPRASNASDVGIQKSHKKLDKSLIFRYLGTPFGTIFRASSEVDEVEQ